MRLRQTLPLALMLACLVMPRAGAADFVVPALRSAVNAALDGPVGPEDGGPFGSLTAEETKDAVIPDVVTVDFSQTVAFTNGRAPETDVMDTVLQLVLNRTAGITDAVNSNDVAFSSTFPFLAPPHQPEAGELPAGGGPPPAAGDGFNWAFALMIGAGGALGLASAGLILRRRTAL